MNAVEIKERLLNNPDELVQILEHFEFEHIKVKKDYIFFAHSVDSSPTGCSVKLNEHLYSKCYTKSIEGDIFSFLMQMRKLSFVDVVREIKRVLKIEGAYKKKEPVFGGFFKSIKTQNRRNAFEINLQPIISEEDLKNYDNGYNLRFLKDHISLETQKEFRVGYDINSDRISLLWRNYEGEVIGIMGRANYTITDDTPKWLPIIPFPKSQFLYGYSENYPYLYNNNKIFIGESEKFVLQLASYQYRNAIALGCSSISDIQIKKILELNPKEIVFCFDEGLDTEVIKKNVLKIKNYIPLLNIRVGVLIDKESKYLPRGSKASPSDYGRKVFENLEKECVSYVK